MTDDVDQYPLAGTRAQVMLEAGIKAAQAAGRSQRDVAKELGYKSSVVLSHMALGRVAIPFDRAGDIAKLLGIDPKAFKVAVLEQRHPNEDFNALFGVSYSSEETVRKLEAVAGCSLNDLPADTRTLLEEVVAARNPRRRWLALPEIATMELVRRFRPESSKAGLRDEDHAALERVLKR
jgi:hypothetical protein